MSFGKFMRASFWEYLLVVVSAWSVATVGLDAFFLYSISDALGYWGRALLSLGVVVLLVAVLYAASWRRRQLAAGAFAYVALLALVVAAALALSNGENLYEDVEGNYLYFAIVCIAAATGCFVLTRTLAGSGVWLAAGSFACSVVQALYRTDELALSLVAVLSALALIVHKNIRLGLEKAEDAAAPVHARNFAASVLPAVAVGVIAILAWFVVIAPLDPGVVEMKLVTDYRKLPMEVLKGTAEEQPVLDYSMKSDNLVDGERYTTDDLLEDPSSTVTVDARSMLEQQLVQEVTSEGTGAGSASGAGTLDDLDTRSDEPRWDTLSWSELFPWIIVIIILCLLAIAAICAYFVGRRARREKRLRKMLSLEPREQVRGIYLYLLGKMERIGFKVPSGVTLARFSESSERQMDALTEEAKVSFAEITETFQKCAYGQEDPTEDEVAALAAFYLSFWKGARVHLGTMRYLAKSFRL